MFAREGTVGWRFAGRWIGSVVLGLLLGMIAFLAVGILVGEAIDEAPDPVFGLVIGTIFGLAFGIAQWRALRPRLGDISGWVWGTLTGFVVAAAVIFGLMAGGSDDTSAVTKLGHGLVLGLAVGIGQWLAVRNRVAASSLWIGISVVTWLLAEVVGM